MANRNQIQTALHKPYDKLLFAKEVLSPVFGSGFSLSSNSVLASVQPNKSEQTVIDSVSIYGSITLEDSTEIICYEILLQPTVRIEQSKVAIQRYVRKLLTAGQAALVNFVAPQNKNVWRLTLVAKDSELTDEGIKEKTTHAKRYTYLLGPNETCKTAAERFETLSTERQINFQALVNAFSVEKLSKAFFDEYTLHYENFIQHLNGTAFKKTVFKSDEKAIRDFTKKLLGRIVFLYFVQKKGWLGASDLEYKDGLNDFMKSFFKSSGGDETFYSNWLTVLFFETLNKERANDDFKMPDGKKLKVPFLNGGLFDKEEHDESILTFKAKLFHNPDNEDVILTEKNKSNSRGFLDFLNSFNFTVHEDSPDDHTVAVDPEMLGHIFENLLEDNKDKGAYYTPKEIVHYMCQESLTEYLSTHLNKEYTVYKQIGKEQIEIFGNDSRQGQLKMMQQLGDKALNHDDVAYIVKHKDISQLTKPQLKRIDSLLDSVKICDPAIGSGAFPMGLLQEIFAIKEVIAYELGNKWKPAEVKENIIQNSIYGVDIEKGAVDIARLRFWLSLVVDEDKPRALPNLDYKIVVGDSLVSKFENEIIEIDWEVKDGTQANIFGNENVLHRKELLNQITEKQKEYFASGTSKKKLSEKIRLLKIEILINQLELMIKTNGIYRQPLHSEKKFKELNELYLQTQDWKKTIGKLQKLKNEKDKPFIHFDYRLDFPEVLNPNLVTNEKERGFDIVIGNPPYINIKNQNQETRDILKSDYKFSKGADIYVGFFELGLNILKDKNTLAFIMPNKFFGAEYGKLVRQFIQTNITIHSIWDLKDIKVFENAQISTIVFIVSKDKPKNERVILKTESGVIIIESIFDSSGKIQIESSDEDKVFLKSLHSDTKPLSSFATIRTGVMGFEYWKMKPIIISNGEINSNQVPIYTNGNLSRYKDRWQEEEITLYKKKYKSPVVILDSKFLNQNTIDLFKLKPKIIVRGVSREVAAILDTKGCGLLVAVHSIIPKKNIHAFLGIINSKLANWYHLKTFYSIRIPQGSLKYPVDFLNTFPIPINVDLNPLDQVVSYMLYLRTKEFSSVTDQLMPTYFEQIIDGMVYELYFPELLKKHNKEILKHLGELPAFKENMSEEKKMSICKTVFNRLDEREHPVRVNLFYMNSIPEIKIIEGKNENN